MLVDEPIITRSLSDLALERLTEAMALGQLAPGERVSEADLARRFGISRGPLREAISRLEGRNLVAREPRVGVRVVNLSLSEFQDLFVMREALEGMACRLAATRMSDQELRELREVLDRHSASEPVRDGVSYFQASGDEDFHFRVIRGSKNMPIIRTLLDELYHVIRVYRYRSSEVRGRTPRAVAEHAAILHALEARDPDEAERAMRLHIARARENLSVDAAGTAAPS